ncbi:alpha/beta fold hydrolase [Puniceibacterium sp. IMCC21224]|uniref:alpha/beta fold hydrolase n=1 Tax=Puniceibacterium sp. IMCC21224 TaxID=1618204 RepID=UPI00064DD780|nr:alpha/beta hydrolase [Puniceibacterium sp. IMCC21224]KMK67902.1 putative hydrolase or acyltransferase of alpha/beta superfamily [Puniceibacterium sp. IMCC21224]
MAKINELVTAAGRRLAFAYTPGEGPVVVFLSGYKSDMEGTKAVHLEAWAQARGRAFLRFDYSGHGASGGRFEDGCIGDWAADAEAVISQLSEGPLVLVGSSMGGWIGCLVSQHLHARIVGFVGIAAAPDFTEDGFWAGFDADQKAEIAAGRTVSLPSDYGDPYMITPKLIEDGRQHLVLRTPLRMPWPVRLLQGTEDTAVTRNTALRLLDHIAGTDVRLSFVKGADHRFSDPACLAMIEAAVTEVGG